MEQGFGINWDARANAAFLLTNIVFLGVVVASIVWLHRSTRRPVRRSDLALWCGVLLAAYIIINNLPRGIGVAEAFRLSIDVYVFFICIVAGTGVLQTGYRLVFHGRSLRLGSVLATIGPLCLLMALMVTAAPQAREAARRTTCNNHLKQIGLALHNYHSTFDAFPAAASGDPAVSWRVRLLPYLDDNPLYNTYDQTKTWDSPENTALALRQLWIYECLSNPHHEDAMGRCFSDFAMVTGSGTFGGNPAGVKTADITDGASNTIAVVEASGLQIVWTEPRDFDVTTQPIGINLKGTGRTDSPGILSSYHLSKGAHVLLADGSVKFIKESVDPNVLKKLTTIAGDEKIDVEF